jgi:hypothetical protein
MSIFDTVEYEWRSEDTRDRSFAEKLNDDMIDFCYEYRLDGLLILVKENFTDPPEAEPHFLNSYKLGSVKCDRWTGGLGRIRPSGARVTQSYVATANGDSYNGIVTILVCGSYGYHEIDKKAALYALSHYKTRIEEVFPEWSTAYQGEPHVEINVEWIER